ncbi:MAG: TolC family protein, partial [Polyangiaceae bacterium]
GTSTQAARASFGASVPLVILGQRGAAIRASEADLATVHVETEVAWTDVRAGAAHAFVALWIAERTAAARADAAVLTQRLENTITERVALGAAPELDALRARAERLRADADAAQAKELVFAAGGDLARWMGTVDGAMLRAAGAPDVPAAPPPFNDLVAQLGVNPAIRREVADAQAAAARASRERALNRPALSLDVGTDVGDPTLNGTNYRAQLGIEVPIFNQRGAFIERENAAFGAAKARESVERTRARAALEVAYRTFAAATARSNALLVGVVPAADAAAVATEESYTLGRAQLVAVLDVERVRIESRLTLLDALAARANAWIDVEHAVGQP